MDILHLKSLKIILKITTLLVKIKVIKFFLNVVKLILQNFQARSSWSL